MLPVFSFALLPLLGLLTIANSEAPNDLTALVERVRPAIVTVISYREDGEILGTGTGFFVSQDGRVVTNRHVVTAARRVVIKLSKGKRLSVQSVLPDADNDLVILKVLKISDEGFSPLELASTLPKPGEKIVVIGSPQGLEQSVSDGIVSAIRKTANSYLIQITAPISPGSSGSPVINLKGKVVGVATMQRIDGQNLNFAIPSTTVLGQSVQEAVPFQAWSRQNQDAVQSDLQRIADEHYDMARYKETSQFYEQLVGLPGGDTADNYHWLGWSYKGLNLYQKAITAFKHALQIDPNLARAHLGMAACLYLQDDDAQAVEAYRAYIRLEPSDPEGHLLLGRTYSFLKAYRAAIQEFKLAIQLKPDYIDAHEGLILEYAYLLYANVLAIM